MGLLTPAMLRSVRRFTAYECWLRGMALWMWQVVMLELCRARRSALSAEKNERLTMVEMVHLITRKHVPAWQVLYSWFLSRYGTHHMPPFLTKCWSPLS